MANRLRDLWRRLRPLRTDYRYDRLMAAFDPQEMLTRFKERAASVKRRPLPPVAGEERQRFVEQAQLDFQDFAMIADAQASLEDGILTLRVDLRPPDQRS